MGHDVQQGLHDQGNPQEYHPEMNPLEYFQERSPQQLQSQPYPQQVVQQMPVAKDIHQYHNQSNEAFYTPSSHISSPHQNFHERLQQRNPIHDQGPNFSYQSAQPNPNPVRKSSHSGFPQGDISRHSRFQDDCNVHFLQESQQRMPTLVQDNEVPGSAYPRDYPPTRQDIQGVGRHQVTSMSDSEDMVRRSLSTGLQITPLETPLIKKIREIISKSKRPKSSRGVKKQDNPNKKTLKQREIIENTKNKYLGIINFCEDVLQLTPGKKLKKNIEDQFPQHKNAIANVRKGLRSKKGRPREEEETEERKYFRKRYNKLSKEKQLIQEFAQFILNNWDSIFEKNLSVNDFCPNK